MFPPEADALGGPTAALWLDGTAELLSPYGPGPGTTCRCLEPFTPWNSAKPPFACTSFE